jgi:hypothetical protein
VYTSARLATFPFSMATMEEATKKNATMMYVLVPRHLFNWHPVPYTHTHMHIYQSAQVV